MSEDLDPDPRVLIDQAREAFLAALALFEADAMALFLTLDRDTPPLPAEPQHALARAREGFRDYLRAAEELSYAMRRPGR